MVPVTFRGLPEPARHATASVSWYIFHKHFVYANTVSAKSPHYGRSFQSMVMKGNYPLLHILTVKHSAFSTANALANLCTLFISVWLHGPTQGRAQNGNGKKEITHNTTVFLLNAWVKGQKSYVIEILDLFAWVHYTCSYSSMQVRTL